MESPLIAIVCRTAAERTPTLDYTLLHCHSAAARRSGAAVAALVAACSGEPNGQQWPVIETDDEVDASQEDIGPADAVDVGITPEPDLPAPVLLADSSPCTSGSECAGGNCRTGQDFPDGYCTMEDCAGAGCAAGSTCRETRNDGSYCVLDCSSDDMCGDGLACRRDFRTGLRGCLPIRGAADGEACTSNGDCQNRWCQPDLTGGYCITVGCETSDDCSNQREFDNVCLNNGGGFNNFCVRRCATAADCREHHLCTDVGGGETVCIEDPARPFDESVFAPGPLNVQCGIPVENGLASIPYEIAATTTSYMITPMARDGQPLDARRIVLPDATEMNFVLERWFFKYPSSDYGSMSPTLVPAGPNFMNMLSAGANQYQLGAEGEELCYYLLEKDAPGNTLDLNIYLVGVPNVTAATAAADPRFAAVLAETSRLYEQVGIELGAVRFFDMDDEANMRFGVLRSAGDVEQLAKLSQPPGNDLDSLLSVNVFFVGEFAMRGTLGISGGLPGPAGLHGTQGSGVVFTAEYMGTQTQDASNQPVDGNLYTALLLVHEVGHWLGLFHTTETDWSTSDPLEDTGACVGNEQTLEQCPDWGNVMFPLADAGNTTLTADQGFVLRGNPAVRTVPGVTP